jgi:hypothetical protein
VNTLLGVQSLISRLLLLLRLGRVVTVLYFLLLSSSMVFAQSTATSGKSSESTTLNKCPVKLVQLIPLRGFSLGMSPNDLARRFQGNSPPLSRPDVAGIRTMEVRLSRPQDPRGSTGLDKLEFKFFAERLYQIKAYYSVGQEWKQRPMSEFAEAISRGLGVDAKWAERDEKEFIIPCGDVRLDLSLDDDSYVLMGASSRLPIAEALLILTDTAAESQAKSRRNANRERERQSDAEKRKIFKP